MEAIISEQDLGHMRRFPPQKKLDVIQEMMSRVPVKEWNLDGNNNYVKTILRLRASGLKLIDLQPQENAFTAIWYNRSSTLLSRTKSEIAALVVWELNAGQDKTTLKVWNI